MAALCIAAGCAGNGSRPAAGTASGTSAGAAPKAHGWLTWRGPNQNGTSAETGLPTEWEPGGKNHLWTLDLPGKGTPSIDGDRVYAWGYRGEEEDLVEVLLCLEADTGKKIWEREFPDYLSDIIYDRYSIGGPTVDPETGNIYLMSSCGLVVGLDRNGKILWEHSLMEAFGKLTFPNGRTGTPIIDGDLVITNVISTNWGKQGPPRNRFYAFDKKTGQPVWASTPGVGPPVLKDSSFSTPYFTNDHKGRRVFYAGTGCGNVVCVNAKTGEPIWRYQMSIGGVNSSVVIKGNLLNVIHGKENLDSSANGRMVTLKLDTEPKADPKGGVPLLDKSAEAWRIDGLSMFTSSPVLVGDRVYQVSHTGDLHCIDIKTGKEHWKKKLGTSQLHASPLYADGKLYVSMHDGTFYILKLKDDGADVLTKTKLDGQCFGSPAAWNGKVYIFTSKHLYCFGTKGNSPGAPKAPAAPAVAKAGKASRLQIIPNEVVLQPGESATFDVRKIDANGHVIDKASGTTWAKFIPPTAKVKAKMDADFNGNKLVAKADATPSAGAYKATAGDLSGTIRGRVLTRLPFSEDFEKVELNAFHKGDNAKFAYPPLAWIGARFKWEIREKDGSKVLTKTIDRVILQRAITFIGKTEESNYTVSADVMTDGNRRMAGEVGVINQRYMIVLKGNHDQIEVNSNHERLKVGVDFKVKPKTWYSLKSRVDMNKDGSAVIRAKAWPRGTPEPDKWTIEVPHKRAHKKGAPGVFGFGPQNKVRVYVDNIKITPNK